MILFSQRWNKTGTSDTKILPKIVLLHGMGGTGALWRPLAAGLEDKIAVLAPDQRGHGRSQISATTGTRHSTGYSPLDYGQDIIDTLEAENFYPTWILGHSMGVRTAVAAAHLKPDWINGLILIDLGFSGVAGGGLGDGLAQFLKSMPMEFSTRDDARNYITQHCPDPAIGQYLMAVSVKTADARLTFPFDRAALIETIEAAKHASVRNWVKKLAELGKTILVLRGANSLVWSHENFEAEKKHFHSHPTVRFLEIPDAGHGLPFEQRSLLVRLIEDLIL